MGLFDSLFGGGERAAREAAAKTSALYDRYGAEGRDIFGTYGTEAGGALTTGLGEATGALGAGLEGSVGAYGNALDAIKAGTAGALGAYTPLSDLSKKYGGAVDRYYDALGLTGPEGVARAKAGFTTSPGYEFGVNEALKGITNKASAFGGVLGGNTLSALQDRSANLANKEYNTYLDRLAGFVAPELEATRGAASGLAGVYGTGAGLTSGTYGNLAGAYGANAARMADLFSGTGQNRANIYGNVAQGLAGIGRDVTGGQAQGINQVANAKAQDTANYWNFLGNLAGGVSKAFLPGK